MRATQEPVAAPDRRELGTSPISGSCVVSSPCVRRTAWLAGRSARRQCSRRSRKHTLVPQHGPWDQAPEVEATRVVRRAARSGGWSAWQRRPTTAAPKPISWVPKRWPQAPSPEHGNEGVCGTTVRPARRLSRRGGVCNQCLESGEPARWAPGLRGRQAAERGW